MNSATTVICGGGGGVPVLTGDNGHLKGAQAVVDKDLTASLLAVELGADRLVILTDIDAVRRNFGTPHEPPISLVNVDELAS